MNKGYKYSYVFRIITRYLERRYSAGLEEKVQEWLLDSDRAEEKEFVLEKHWESLDVKADKSIRSSLNKVKAKAGIVGSGRMRLYAGRIVRKVAAAIIPLFVVGAGAMLYFNAADQGGTGDVISVQTIAAEGTESLCEILPDGTVVWLNAGSEISYLEGFTGDVRRVFLKGEAFFEVAHDESKPFIVETESLNVKALGTEFNVKAYVGEASSVTLVTGKVEVETGDERKIFSLEPDQQLILDNTTSNVSLYSVEGNDAAGWTSGHLIFDNATLGEILKTLERSRGIRVEMNEAYLSGERFSVKFVNNESTEEILGILDILTGGFSYSLENHTLRVN